MSKRLSPPKKNTWIATAAYEVYRIRLRWKITSERKFSAKLCINARTLAKLNPLHPDASLQLETLDRIYSIFLALVYVEFDTPEEIIQECSLIIASRIRIMQSVAPLPQGISDRIIDEIDHL